MGGCFHCGDKWNWKEYHLIRYSGFNSIFPYCEECHMILSIDEKIKYVDQLMAIWYRCDPLANKHHKLVSKLAKQAVRDGK